MKIAERVRKQHASRLEAHTQWLADKVRLGILQWLVQDTEETEYRQAIGQAPFRMIPKDFMGEIAKRAITENEVCEPLTPQVIYDEESSVAFSRQVAETNLNSLHRFPIGTNSLFLVFRRAEESV